jgi:hypothetical protein
MVERVRKAKKMNRMCRATRWICIGCEKVAMVLSLFWE